MVFGMDVLELWMGGFARSMFHRQMKLKKLNPTFLANTNAMDLLSKPLMVYLFACSLSWRYF
jgi:hypothetical protein